MKISEIATKTDKQFHEDLGKSIGLTLRKFGNKVGSALGNKSAKEEALVLEVIDQLQSAFIAKNKVAGKVEGQTSFTDLANFLASAGIQDKAIKQGFKTAFAVVDTPDTETETPGDTTPDSDTSLDGGAYEKSARLDIERFYNDKEYQEYVINTPAYKRWGATKGNERSKVDFFSSISLNKGFKVGDMASFTPTGQTEPVEREVMGQDANRPNHLILRNVKGLPFSIPVAKLQRVEEPSWTNLKKFPAESIIREFKADDLIPKARLVDGIESVVRIQYRLNGLKGIQIPEYLGNPTKRIDQLMQDVSREMDKEIKNRDTDGDGVIDDIDGDGQPDAVDADGDGQPDQPEVDDETVNQIAAQIFTLTPDQRAMLTQAIRARNTQLQQGQETDADADETGSTPSDPPATEIDIEKEVERQIKKNAEKEKKAKTKKAKPKDSFKVSRAMGAGKAAADKLRT